MKRVYEGKTKDVFELENGNYLLKFKDDACGENGIFDPGANAVGLTIEGMGKASLLLTDFFFRRIHAAGIPSHFVASDIENATMTVLPAVSIGQGLEMICRYKVVGSFLKRYGLYVTEGMPLNALVEMTLKDDERNDPLITQDALEMLGILKPGEYEHLKNLTVKICEIVRGALAEKGLELYDIKIEFGRINGKDDLVLIDEISAGNMRAYKDGKRVEPLDLARIMVS
jgi:phosphoribosylaminoimidazole-succinocarboxamide synthase